jgi:hypothetical protein
MRSGQCLVLISSRPEAGSVDNLVEMLLKARDYRIEGEHSWRISQSTPGAPWRISPVPPADDLYIEVLPGLVAMASLLDDSRHTPAPIYPPEELMV